MFVSNRNIESNCLKCKENIFSYVAKQFKAILNLALCQDCYNLLQKEIQGQYISRKGFKDYQLDKIKENAPYLLKINDCFLKVQFDKILTKDQQQMINEDLDQIKQLEIMLTDVEQGRLEQISQLLIKISQYQPQDQKFKDFYIAFLLAQETIHLERVDAQKFQNQQNEFFDHFNDFFELLATKSLQNQASKEISQRIEAKIDYPIILQITGDLFNNSNQSQFQIQNYYGFLSYEKTKTGIGFWNQSNYMYFGIFYKDVFLWGIKVIIYSTTQYTLYDGYFSKSHDEQNNRQNNIFIDGKGLMYSKDENDEYHEYQGQFLKEKRHGQGNYVWYSKDKNEICKYVGNWQNDVYHGYGTLNIQNQGIIIQGEFSLGQPIIQNCNIQGKDIPQQSLKDYVVKVQQKNQENQLIKQQNQMLNNQQYTFANQNQKIQSFLQTPQFQQFQQNSQQIPVRTTIATNLQKQNQNFQKK